MEAPGIGWCVRSSTIRGCDDYPAGGIIIDTFDWADPDTGEICTFVVTLDPQWKPGDIGWRHTLAASDVDETADRPDLHQIVGLLAMLADEVRRKTKARRTPARDEMASLLATMTRLWHAAWDY